MPQIPEWFDLVRAVATLMIYIMFPLQIWSFNRNVRLHREWQRAENARQQRWERDMDDAGKLRQEAYHLREQAEISLALANRRLS